MGIEKVLIPYAYATPENGAIGGKVAGVIAGAARSVMCPLYRDYPAFMTGSWANSPMADYNDGFLNEFCTPAGQLPNPPQLPFTGGQCVGVRYRITGSGTYANGDAFGISGVFDGTINSVKIESGNPNSQGDPTVNVIARVTLRNPTRPTVNNLIGPMAPGARILSVSVTREDGLPDNCGDPKPTYPITRPPDAALRPNIPVQISPNFAINAPVAIFAPITNLTPSLKIGDFNVNFDLGGLTIDLSPTINPPGTSPNGDPPIQPSPGDNPATDENEELNGIILRYLKRIRECQECDLDYTFLATGAVGGRAGAIATPSGGTPVAVGLQVVTQPSNAKFQPGLGQPDVLYAGWCWFEGNGYVSERLPIDSTSKLFYAPSDPSPTAFRFTMQTGHTAQAIMTYKVKKDPLPNV